MGGSSKQTVGYWYYWAMHFGWCKGPIDALLELRGGDATMWQGRLTASGQISIRKPNLWGGEGDQGQGGVVGDMDVMFGEPTQAPNDYLAATFGPQQSGHRGKFSTVFRGGKFGAYAANPKPVSAKVERILTDWQDGVVWYPDTARIDMSQAAANSELGPTSDGWSYKIVALTDTADYSADVLDVTGWGTGQMPFASAPGQPYAEAAGFPAIQNTAWALNTRIWLRRTFSLSAVVPVTLTVFIDNTATVWVNGQLVLPTTNTTQSANTFTIPAAVLRPGQNTIVLRGDDDAATGAGDYSYAAFKLASQQGFDLYAMNPAHMLYDSITHADLQGEPVGIISDASFRAAADKLYSEGFGLCTDYDSSAETPQQFQQRLCNVIGGCLSQSRVDGLYYLDLIRGDYDLASLPIIGEDDIIAFSQDASVITETGNMMRVEWTDPQAKEDRTTPPLYAMGNVQSAGRVIACEPKTYHEIPVESLALRVAKRDLQGSSTPLAKFGLTTKGTLRGLRPGMNARLQVPSEGIADLVVVIGSVAHGTATDGKMKIVAVQNVYGLPAAVYVQPQAGLWTAPDTSAAASPHQRAFESPYLELAQTMSAADLNALTADAGYVLTVASAPATGLNYLIDTAAAGEDYAERGSGEWCPTATINEAAGYLDTAFTTSAAQLLDRVAVGSWALWDDEIVRVDAIDATTGALTLGRGCADTAPATHAAGSRIYLCGEWVSTDKRAYVGGDVVGVKLLTRTASDQQDVASATALSVTLNDRQARPYPPGNLTINGARYPAAVNVVVALAWAHRDRLLSADQLVDTLQASVGPEAGTTYTVDVYLGGVLDSTTAGLTGTSYTPTISGDGTVQVQVIAQRDGLDSWQALAATFDYSRGDVRVTEAGDIRVTEAGETRVLES